MQESRFRSVLAEIVREVLPEVVREVISERLDAQFGPSAAPRPARTVKPAKAEGKRPGPKPRPAEAAEHGVKVGQRWRGKDYTGAKGRLIEIALLGKDKVVPKVIRTAEGRKPTAKAISYAQLSRTYELVGKDAQA